MTIAPTTGFVLDGRRVYTYAPDGRNRAVATGYDLHQDDGLMFVVEHIVVFAGEPRATPLRFARAALAEAWDQGYASVTFCLPTDRGRPWSALAALGRRLGFASYERREGLTWWLCRRPA